MLLCKRFENIFKDQITFKQHSINVTGRTFVDKRTFQER